jgi:hypothetical protein
MVGEIRGLCIVAEAVERSNDWIVVQVGEQCTEGLCRSRTSVIRSIDGNRQEGKDDAES